MGSQPGFSVVGHKPPPRARGLAASPKPEDDGTRRPRLHLSLPMIEAENLTKLYDKFTAVDDLSLTVRSGEVLGLVGCNGAGKTTTLRCLSGIIPPTRGQVRLCGHDLAADPMAAKRQLAFF